MPTLLLQDQRREIEIIFECSYTLNAQVNQFYEDAEWNKKSFKEKFAFSNFKKLKLAKAGLITRSNTQRIIGVESLGED